MDRPQVGMAGDPSATQTPTRTAKQKINTKAVDTTTPMSGLNLDHSETLWQDKAVP